MSLHKVHTKCAKLVDEKIIDFFIDNSCESVRDFEPKFWSKVYILHILK